MPLIDSEILWRPAQTVSATAAQNGGRISIGALVTSGVKNAMFPDVSQAERTAGLITWRKAFVHIANADSLPLLNARLYLDAQTPAGDFVTLHPGTQTDTEATTTGRAYGIATLAGAAIATDTAIEIAPENVAAYATLEPFRVGDVARISNKEVLGGSGTEEFVTVATVTAGATTLLTFTPALANAYATANTIVSSVIETASIAASFGSVVVTSTAGTFDHATAGNVTFNAATLASLDLSLTFTSATEYDVINVATSAVIVTGNISATVAVPNGPTIIPAAFGGTWATNDTITLTTTPAAFPLWYRREVPAGTVSVASDSASVAVTGESA